MRDTKAYVYVMSRPDGAIKIGVSKDPKARWKILSRQQTGLQLIHITRLTAVAYETEAYAHRLFRMAGHAVKGQREWFHTTLDEARHALRKADRIARGIEPDRIKRKIQMNIRVSEAEIEMINNIKRRSKGVVPGVSEIVRRALIELDREDMRQPRETAN